MNAINKMADMPGLEFRTLIPDAATTISDTWQALAAGFRHFDCAERYRNEREVAEVLKAGLADKGIARRKCHAQRFSIYKSLCL